MSDNRGTNGRRGGRRARRGPPAAGEPPRQVADRATGRRRRRRAMAPRWLANRRVRTKLAGVLIIPTVAFLLLAGVNVVASMRGAAEFAAGGRVAELCGQVTALTHELQRERDLTAGDLAGGKAGGAALTAQRVAVDRAIAAYVAAQAPLADQLGPRLRDQLGTARARLGRRAGLRGAVDARALSDRAVFDEYSAIIRALLAIELEVDQRRQNDQYTQRVRAFTNLSQLKEITAQVRGTLYSIAAQGGFSFGQFQELADLLAEQRSALDRFLAEANDQQRERYARTVRGQAVLAGARIRQTAVNRQASAELGLDPQQWFAASAVELELLRTVELGLLGDVVTQSAELSAEARRGTATAAALIALTLLIALLTSLGVAESMARPLRHLRRGAQQIADERLPDVVHRLHTSMSAELSGDVEAVGIDSRDEIGDLAQAFDDVHRQAVRLAAEQAALRSNVSSLFLNLARRSQTLVDRLLARISELEHEEADPAELEKLYLLDHLATRVRRNAENLVVLSSTEPPIRRWGAPVPVGDVVEAAIAEVEDYARVDVGVVDEVPVTGRAASDLTHLLAELIENATTFSPPNAPVVVTGAAVGNGYVIEIEDRGLGMTDDELLEANQRLAEPPMLDFSVRQRLGLHVVARLAQRYDIRVQLRHSAYGGIVALIRLPVSLFLEASPAGLDAAAPMPALVGGDGVRSGRARALSSDWFDTDLRSVYMPLRPHGVRRAQAWSADDSGPLPELPRDAAEPGAALPPLPPPPAGPGGLPQRVPKPRKAAKPTAADRNHAGDRPPRTPEKTRSAMANYQRGLIRGRAATTGHEAADDQQTGGDPRPRHENTHEPDD